MDPNLTYTLHNLNLTYTMEIVLISIPITFDWHNIFEYYLYTFPVCLLEFMNIN